jgi:phage portal protein BeeE
VQSTNEASQFLETRQYQVIEICRAYRVDPSYVQDKTKVGYASQEQAAIDLVQQTLLPWFRRWESAITRDLLSETTFSSLSSIPVASCVATWRPKPTGCRRC